LEARLAQSERQITELRRENAELRATLAERDATIAELEGKLGQSSRNSSKPPSSDTPVQRAERTSRPRSGRKPGGQPGHEGNQRQLLPPEKVTRRVHRRPRRCRGCHGSLDGAEELEATLHQVVELPPITPDVTEYVLGRRQCPHCQTVTTARLPRGVPRGMCGPRLMALIALLTGAYNLTRRNAVALLDDVLGIQIAIGTLSKVEGQVADVLAPAHSEALTEVRQADVKHLDATSWSQNGQPRSLWGFVSRLATVFVITATATTEVAREIVGRVRGVLVTDRGSQFGFWVMKQRQICWAHLARKFVAFTESTNAEARELGQSLLYLTLAHLDYSHRVRDGTATRAALRELCERLEPVFIGHLERGAALRLRGVSGACANILAHREALFTYARVEGVPPTNNVNERELRHAVRWRRQTAGSRSDRGDRYAERILTVVHTLRRNGRHVFAYLEQACAAALRGRPIPALIPPTP
jgi:transposase